MRIGLDARTLFRPDLKGIGRYVEGLLDQLLAVDGQHEYLLFYQPGDIVDRTPSHPRVRAIPVQARSEPVWEQWALPRAVAAAKVDLFHSTANTTMAWPPGPTVLTLHDAMSHMAAKHWGRREHAYWNWLQPMAYRRLKRIVAPSEFAKRQIVETLRVPASRIDVVYNGIRAEFRPLDRAIVTQRLAALGVDGPYLFAVGGRGPHKNLVTLLRAFAAIALRIPDHTLIISGMQGFQPVEAARAELPCASRIRLLPYVSQDPLVALYNGATAFVYSSLGEGFGFVPVEAMACGAAVIASDAASIPEVTAGGAYSVDCRTPEPLAAAMLRVLADPSLRQDLGQRGQTRAAEFAWSRTAERMLGVYDEAAR